MSEVRHTQLQKSALRFVRRWWPAVLIPGVAVAALVGHGSTALKEAANPVPAPSAQPVTENTGAAVNDDTSTVTVNGKPVPLDQNGSVNMTLPDGGHVEVSGGNAKITNENSGGGKPGGQANSSSNVNVSVNSNGSKGNSWSSTSVNGFSNNANGSSNSFNSTNVFSADSSYNDTSSE